MSCDTQYQSISFVRACFRFGRDDDRQPFLSLRSRAAEVVIALLCKVREVHLPLCKARPVRVRAIVALHTCRSLRSVPPITRLPNGEKSLSLDEFLVGLIYGTVITARAQRAVCLSVCLSARAIIFTMREARHDRPPCGMWRGENSRFFARSHSFRPIPSRSRRLSTVSSRRGRCSRHAIYRFPFPLFCSRHPRHPGEH